MKLTAIDAQVCELILNELLVPQCKDIAKFECCISGMWLIIDITWINGYRLTHNERELFRAYLNMIEVGFMDYMLRSSDN